MNVQFSIDHILSWYMHRFNICVEVADMRNVREMRCVFKWEKKIGNICRDSSAIIGSATPTFSFPIYRVHFAMFRLMVIAFYWVCNNFSSFQLLFSLPFLLSKQKKIEEIILKLSAYYLVVWVELSVVELPHILRFVWVSFRYKYSCINCNHCIVYTIQKKGDSLYTRCSNAPLLAKCTILSDICYRMNHILAVSILLLFELQKLFITQNFWIVAGIEWNWCGW